jgi:DNA-binding NtrC family response regulator
LPASLGGASTAAEDLYGSFATLGEGLAAFTRYFLRRALREEHGDIEAAARRAGMTVAELRERIA